MTENKRIIKFRGKRNQNNGEWGYGLPGYSSGEQVSRITGFSEPDDDSVGGYFDVEIIPETVGQFTGLTDKNGKEIYEGDIIALIDDNGNRILIICRWGIARRVMATGFEVDIQCFYFEKPDGMKAFPIVKNYLGKHDIELYEVIGNIYENPELLKK